MYEFARERYVKPIPKYLISDVVEAVHNESTRNLLYLADDISFRLSISKDIDMDRKYDINKGWKTILTRPYDFEYLAYGFSSHNSVGKYFKIGFNDEDTIRDEYRKSIMIGSRRAKLQIQFPDALIMNSLYEFVGLLNPESTLEKLQDGPQNMYYVLREDCVFLYVYTANAIRLEFTIFAYDEEYGMECSRRLRNNENIADPYMIFCEDGSIRLINETIDEDVCIEVVIGPQLATEILKLRQIHD